MAEIFNAFDNNMQFLFSMNLQELQQDPSLSPKTPSNRPTPTNSDKLVVFKNIQPVGTRRKNNRYYHWWYCVPNGNRDRIWVF